MIELEVQEVPRLKAPRMRKVYYAYYDYEHGEPYPVIRFGGRYLERLGFSIGDPIEVDFDIGRIMITKPAHC